MDWLTTRRRPTYYYPCRRKWFLGLLESDLIMFEARAEDLIQFATAWTSLGRAITEQVEQVIADPSCGSCWNEGTENGVNPEAIRQAYSRLRGMNEELDSILTTFLKSAK